MKDYIDICKKRWTLDIFDKFKDGEIKVHGVSITKELIKNVDEITNIWTYDIWWFVKEYEDSLTGRPHKNRHFCEIKNPYAPKAEDILNRRYKTYGNFYHVLKVRVNDKYGLIDENNNTIIPIENDVIDMVSLPSLPYLIVKNGNISYLYHVLEYQ